MKKSDKKFEWTEEADAAFSQLKKVLSTLPVLVAPKEREPLLLSIAATHQVVSTMLVVERSEEGMAHGVQRHVITIKTTLSTLPKSCVQCVHDSTETMTILRGSSNHSG
jgi:hypothetical protein